jgi:hypothetical protein
MRSAGAAVFACALIAGCGGSAAHTSSAGRAAPATSSTTVSRTVATVPATVPATAPTVSRTVATVASRLRGPQFVCPQSPGTLPQTQQLPSAATPCFHAEMRSLWSAIRTGSPATAMAAFFPEAAYAQIKAIADPRADWLDRLVSDYRLDLAAAHALVGNAAQLVGVELPTGYAHWVDPGACFNSSGYFEVPNSRVVYRRGGELRSLGIASMISWRGVWYVVHLGAVLRSSNAGVVDDPSAGIGVAAPSSTC